VIVSHGGADCVARPQPSRRPACYLKHFAIPQDCYEGELYVYERYSGRTFKSSPHNSAKQMDFYSVEVKGESPALVENTYAKLEARFAPTLAGVVERGTLPTDPTAMREVLAFVASQAVRTPRVRQMHGRQLREEDVRDRDRDRVPHAA
jgi:hypothetical protein